MLFVGTDKEKVRRVGIKSAVAVGAMLVALGTTGAACASNQAGFQHAYDRVSGNP